MAHKIHSDQIFHPSRLRPKAQGDQMYPNSTCVVTRSDTRAQAPWHRLVSRERQLTQRPLPGHELHAFVRMTEGCHMLQTERELNKTETPSPCTASDCAKPRHEPGQLFDLFGKSNTTRRITACSKKPRTATCLSSSGPALPSQCL